VNAHKHTKENRDRLAYLADDELSAYERERHDDPYMSLAMANELRKTALKLWHLGAAREWAEEKAREDARRNLRAKLWPAESEK
jgi:hypothetical protein